jgi:NAD(P)-dependent dehydrogenase (short-subunit alcohol dehydrogenase family)
MKLEKKVALVTGAGSGIGKSTALLFAREGAGVGVLDYDAEAAQQTVAAIEKIGGSALALVADVSQANQVRQAVAELIQKWGTLHVVLANAGINGVWAPIDQIEPDEWDRTLDINLKGTFLTFKYAVPHLKKQGGSVVITASGQGTRNFAVPGSTAYACSKAAQSVFAKKMALELAKDRVRVNVICPGSTDTAINDSGQRRNLQSIQLPVNYPQGKVLLNHGNKVSPEEVAKLALFLASEDAAMITGSEVWIDGAMSLFAG